MPRPGAARSMRQQDGVIRLADHDLRGATQNMLARARMESDEETDSSDDGGGYVPAAQRRKKQKRNLFF